MNALRLWIWRNKDRSSNLKCNASNSHCKNNDKTSRLNNKNSKLNSNAFKKNNDIMRATTQLGIVLPGIAHVRTFIALHFDSTT